MEARFPPDDPTEEPPDGGVMVYEVRSLDTPLDDIACEQLPVVVSGEEALGLCCEVFGRVTG